jgi:predicted phage terminase large subunit-like protein
MDQATPDERFVANDLSRRDLYFFTRWMFLQRRGYKWIKAKQHKIICDALMRVYRGECKRLIINIPPRYSKTEIAVINFIAWTLGRHPDAEYIHTSYSGRLAAGNAWQARELVASEQYQEIFPDTVIRKDSAARDEWRTTKGGCVYAVGAGGSITGYGAGKHREEFGGAIILDDLHKADEARSDVIRPGVIEWFQTTLESRKNSPNTPIILIMQRLHEEDIAGWLLDGGNGEEWEHICLPAIQADGTALWPEKHTIEDLTRMQTKAPYMFSGQYQQEPAPPQGLLFNPEQLQVIEALPAVSIRWVRAWDLASTVDGDWTVGLKLGKTADNRFIIGDVCRVRVGPDQRDAAISNTAGLDGTGCKISLPQDPGQAGKTQVLYLTRSLPGYRVTSSPESGDKITRAEPAAAQVNVGNVSMLKAPWNIDLINEMRMFPNGKHDDIIDALSRAFMELMTGSPGFFGM